MDKKFIWIEMRVISPLLLAAVLGIAGSVHAQSTGITARMLFPPRNYELALGDTITPVARVRNGNATASAPFELHYRIRNIVTNLTVYDDSLPVPSLGPGDSITEVFGPYASNANILKELGSFHACITIGADSTDPYCTRFFGVRRTSVPYRDPSNSYSHTVIADIPDQTLWISEGTTVVDGEDSTWDPPPPRDGGIGDGPDSLHSPVMRLDRKDEAENFYSGSGVGDTLTSFPINLQGKTKIVFHFDYMRAGRNHYPLGWDDSLMIGPESTILDSAGSVIRSGDSLILEFKKPSAPEVNPSPNDWNEMAAIDGGHDFEFKSFYARPVPGGWHIRIDNDTSFLADTSNYFTAGFRFRFRLKASDNGLQSSLPIDDADPWYIDNPTVEVPLVPELEVRWVRVVNPYTKVPLSQANFPVYVNILNSNYDVNIAVPFLVEIHGPQGNLVYSQRVILNTLATGADTALEFPNWDASSQMPYAGGEYLVSASLDQAGYDSYNQDNQTYSKFFLNVESGPDAIQEFAWDDAGLTPQPGVGNDIPKLTGILRSGIGFNDTSGSFAMKFQLTRTDTLYGVRAFFSNDDVSPDYTHISILKGDSNSCIPLDTVSQPGVQSTMFAQIGGNAFNQFWPYYFPKPIVLPAGIYWAAVSQIAPRCMQLGGDISRGGGQLASVLSTFPRIGSTYSSDLYGTQWGSEPADNSGNMRCTFAVEIPAGSGNWKPMMPDSGLWPTMDSSYPLFWHFLPNLDRMPWNGAGTYLPMIRPMIGQFFSPPSGISATSAMPMFGLVANYPNPFDPTSTSTTITFTLPKQSAVSLIVSNTLGDVVKTLVNSTFSAGPHSVGWDGRDERGAMVPPGVYFVRLFSLDSRAMSKIIVSE